MMKEELGMALEDPASPLKNGLATFVAFVVAGFLPLMPYLFGMGSVTFNYSIGMTAIALFVIGAARTMITKKNWLVAGLEMLGVGAVAAGVAYYVGYLIEKFFI